MRGRGSDVVGQNLAMADLVDMFTRSIARFGERVDQVADAQWEAATPCEDWDVRALVNHVTYEQRWAPHLVSGETLAQVGDRYDGDVLGDDAKSSVARSITGSVAAFQGADLDATVHLSFGDVPCGEYLAQMLTDAEVHGWDLAVSTGQDPSMLPDASAFLLEFWSPRQEMIRASGVFGPEVDVPDDADHATQLLALLGRTRP